MENIHVILGTHVDIDGRPAAPKAPRLELPRKWKAPLLYPFDGPKRANVEYDDLDRLNDEEFLNDNIMNFYLRFVPK